MLMILLYRSPQETLHAFQNMDFTSKLFFLAIVIGGICFKLFWNYKKGDE